MQVWIISRHYVPYGDSESKSYVAEVCATEKLAKDRVAGHEERMRQDPEKRSGWVDYEAHEVTS